MNQYAALDNSQGSEVNHSPQLSQPLKMDTHSSLTGAPSSTETSENSNNSENLSRSIDHGRKSESQAAPQPSEKVFKSQETKLSRVKEALNNYDWEGSWTWEAGGAILSVTCLALLIGFLGYVNGKAYISWQYSISPNAVISVLAAFIKAAMLIPVSACLGQLKWGHGRHPKPTQLYHFHLLDQASRGPWGSLEILWRVRSFLALAGAALMATAVAIDPFAQQILAFPSRQVQALNETAYVQKAQDYSSKWDTSTFQMDHTMQPAVFNGLAQINIPLNAKCPSESCHYPDFTTLGICTSCEDVTEAATQDCRPISRPYDGQNSTLKWKYWHDILSHPSTPSLRRMAASIPIDCKYSAPNGFTFVPGAPNASTSNDTIEIFRSGFRAIVPKPDVSESKLAQIISVFMAKYNPDTIKYTTENISMSEPKPQMTQCSVQLCEKQYTQNHVSTNKRNVQPSRSQSLRISNYHGDTATRTLIPVDGAKALSSNSTYHISRIAHLQLQMHLGMLFDAVLSRFDGKATSGLLLAPILNYSDNITESFSRMATSMTDNIRSGTGLTKVYGRAYRTETFIHVRWPWVILPIVTVILSICLFMTTAIVSRGQPVLWKSSIFPLLMGQLEVDREHEISNLRHLGKIHSMSKKIRIVVEGEDRSPLLFSER